MAKNKTCRSSNDGKAWKCRCGTVNNPTKHRFFNLPAFNCSKCGEELALDFKFCLGEIEVGGKSLIGKVLDQGKSPYCVAFAYAKTAEVTERVFSINSNTDPESVVPVDPFALEQKFFQKFPSGPPSHVSITQRGVHKVLHMGLILRSEGCKRVQSKEFDNKDQPYKAPDISTVPRDSFEAVCKDLAEGTPFVCTYLAGKRRSRLPYCKVYKSPPPHAFEAKKAPEIGHAVVIIGAGIKKGKKYFYFLNSWGKKFCPRRNKRGETVKGGIGKVRAEDLTKNLIKLCPPGQIGGERSLQHQTEDGIDPVNYILMTAKEKQYSAEIVQRLREKANPEFVPSDDGIFRDDEGGVCPQTRCAKSEAVKVIKKLIGHFPIKRASLRVRFTEPKLNFTGLMEKVAKQNDTAISNDESGTQPSIVCEIEPSILHSCEEGLKDVQGRVEVQSVSAHTKGGPSVKQHDSGEVPQAALAKGPDAVAQISDTMQKQSISTESQGSAQGKQQRRCKECDALVEDKLYREHCQCGWHKHNYTCHKNGLPPLSQEECMAFKVIKKLIEHFPIKRASLRVRFTAPKLNFTGLMEKVSEQNDIVISNDESGTQPSIPRSLVHVTCSRCLKNNNAPVGPWEVPSAWSSVRKGGDYAPPKYVRLSHLFCTAVLVEDKSYREHCQSGWCKHNYTRGLPHVSQEECMVEMELSDSKEDLDYGF